MDQKPYLMGWHGLPIWLVQESTPPPPPPPPPEEARDCDRDSMRPLLQLRYLLTGDSAGTVGREYLLGKALGQSKKRATVCSVLTAGQSHRGNILYIIKTRIFLSTLFLIDGTTERIKSCCLVFRSENLNELQ